jgi:hypothetical protein
VCVCVCCVGLGLHRQAGQSTSVVLQIDTKLPPPPPYSELPPPEGLLSPVTQLKDELRDRVMKGSMTQLAAHDQFRRDARKLTGDSPSSSGPKLVDRMLGWASQLEEVKTLK